MMPQKHRSKWIQEEIDFIKESISEGATLEDITKVISERTPPAILTKANSLGYGNYCDKKSGLTYFKDEIKHRLRRKKDSAEVDESIPTPFDKKIGTVDVADTEIIPKIKGDISYYEGSVPFILKSMKDNACLYL